MKKASTASGSGVFRIFKRGPRVERSGVAIQVASGAYAPPVSKIRNILVCDFQCDFGFDLFFSFSFSFSFPFIFSF